MSSLKDRLAAHLREGVVGFPTALATAVGLVLASPVILTATTGFSVGGAWFVVAMFVAALLMLAQASTFSEACAMLPTTGSVYDYIACGQGRFLALTGTLCAYMLVNVFAGTAETILSGIMATVNFPTLHRLLLAHDAAWSVGVGLVVLFSVLNFFGIAAFSRVEIFLTFTMWTTLLAFGIAGVLEAPAVHVDGLFGASSLGASGAAAMSLLGMAVFMFLGIEFVTPLAPDLRHADRNVPRAMMAGVGMVLVCMLIWGVAMIRQVPNVAVDPKGLVHLLETPDAIPVFAERVMGPSGRYWLGTAFLLAGASTINTMMAGLPRIFHGMAVDGALPRCFAYLHPRYKSPVVGIVVTAAVPIVHAIWLRGNVDAIMPLVLAAVCSWAVAYLLINLSVVSLRYRRPDLPRAYRSPWLPLPQILASVGMLVAIWTVVPEGMDPRSVYRPFAVMLGLAAVYSFIWIVVIKRQSPFAPVPVESVLERGLKRQG